MKTLTVFDLDDTLVNGDTCFIWRTYLQEKGIITDPNYAERDKKYQQQYAEGTLNLAEYMAFYVSPTSHLSTQTVNELLDDCLQTHVMPHIFKEAKTLIKTLTKDNGGNDVLIISATATFIVKAVARALGITHAIGVDLRIENDCITHEIMGTPSFREGKVVRLKEWLTQHDKKGYYDNVTFYTDSINDLPLCEFADITYTVNPCKRLRPIAESKNWAILNWGKRTI